MIFYIIMIFYFTHIKMICEDIQWEGVNIAYGVF